MTSIYKDPYSGIYYQTSGDVPEGTTGYSYEGVMGTGGGGGGGSWGGEQTATVYDPFATTDVESPFAELVEQQYADSAERDQQNYDWQNTTGGSTTGDIDALLALQREARLRNEEVLADQKEAQDAETRAIYNRLIGTLDTQAGDLSARLPIAEGKLQQSFDKVLPEYQKAETGQLNELGRQEYDVRQTERGQVNKAAQLFNELKTAGQAYSGSSVGGAFGELLGRSTAEVIGDARQYASKQVEGINKEILKVKDYFSTKRVELQEDLQLAMTELRQQFQNELNKINDAKRFAEEDKAAARTSALADYSNRIAQVRNAYDLEKINLQKWAYTQNNKLTGVRNKQFQNFLAQSIQSQLSGLQGQRDITRGLNALQGVMGGDIGIGREFVQDYGFAPQTPAPNSYYNNVPTTNTSLNFDDQALLNFLQTGQGG